jgi:HJR/Mrr/RecB family endonuclease
MSFLKRFRSAQNKEGSGLPLWVSYSKDAACYTLASSRPDTEAVEIVNPLALHCLDELAQEGHANQNADTYCLLWDVIYQLLANKDRDASLAILELPPTGALTPALRSENTLDDSDFAIGIEGWFRNGMLVGSVELIGPVAREGTSRSLLAKDVYEVLRAVQDFYADAERSSQSNRKHWGKIRQLAMLAGARMDQFLTDTIVLTPEKLQIQLKKTEVGGAGVVEVQPWFVGAPDNWLIQFDTRRDVPEVYEIIRDDQLIEIVLTPPVRSVLRMIKKMPGRRVAGAFAEKFLSNPYATLGEDADLVIDADQFEEARYEAGITFQRFTAHWKLSGEEISEAGLYITTMDVQSLQGHLELFRTPDDLRRFVVAVESKLDTGLELCEWHGHSLQLLGDTREQVDILKNIYTRWTRSKVSIRAADVLDLKRYSLRVTGIGVQPSIVSPYIPRSDKDPWFPEGGEGDSNIQVTSVVLDNGRTFELCVDKKVFETLKKAVSETRSKGASFVEIPGMAETVSVEIAETLLDELRTRYENSDTRSKSDTTKKAEREELLIQTNIGSTEYLESRAALLKFENCPPNLPTTFRVGVELKEHQKVGVAWLQHLISKAPAYCRGAILADDMGLGKTLQLLTVVVAKLEANPNLAPILVVAPVSLLENWKEEVEKFFEAGTLSILTLYGDSIRRFRAKSQEIEIELIERGFNRFLRDGWLGDSKVILTTYETLRDLEFSLAAVQWSLMICDEAQKIKNPAAMVTRAAKKQNVEFKIVCTGTPVENSLADIWCLFDFIQPGLLGALNDFGKIFRRPIECETDEQSQKLGELRALVEPQVLRRLKTDVAKDLPKKIVVEEARKLPMSKYQRDLYGQALEQYRLRHVDGYKGLYKNQLGLLHFLRKVCTDPREPGRSFDHEPLAKLRVKNPKLDWLIKTLEKIKELDQKAIVFCEFRDMQLMLAYYIEQAFSFRPDIINGDTSAAEMGMDSRQKRIKIFQSAPGFGAIILSPVAVGFGVNIQAANHVIHFTRTWNPAKEDQATDRAYRIGQTREVYVYYPVVCAEEFVTFDVNLDRLLERKRGLSGDMLNGTGNILPSEFDEVVGAKEDVFTERISIEDADSLEPLYFEALIAALWKRRGFKSVKLTPASGDGGVDVVAKTVNVGELVQVKHSSSETAFLGWDAVKEIVAGEKLYALQFPGVQFKKVALTNRQFNGDARSKAGALGVELIARQQLSKWLQDHRLTMIDIEAFLLSATHVVF